MADLGSRIATIRSRLVALDAQRAKGTIDDDAYETARRAAERELAEAIVATPDPTPDPAPMPAGPRPSSRLWVALIVLVVAIAIGGYAFTGSPGLAGIGAPPTPPAPEPGAANEREIGVAEIAAMVDKLATRLKDRPDDAEGWTMLARSYTVLGRYSDAIPAYRHALELKPKDAGLMADYADGIAASNGGQQNAESLALIDRALAIDANQPKALALAGTIAFDRGDFAGAIARWQKIADALPADGEYHKQVTDNIEEARRRAGMQPSPTAPSPQARSSTTGPAGSTGPAVDAKTTGPAPAVEAKTAGREALSGVVSLDPSLAAQASPTDTVFVLARPETGRMPLAVFRATVKDLPLRFTLDDSMAMTPTMKISDLKQVVVAARISKSGNAITQPGDLAAESKPVAPGTSGLSLVISTVVPAR